MPGRRSSSAHMPLDPKELVTASSTAMPVTPSRRRPALPLRGPFRRWMAAVGFACAAVLVGCGEPSPAPAPTPVPVTPRPFVGATVAGLPTAAVTRDPYALPTSTPYGGIRPTGTVTPTASPSATPSRTASPTPTGTPPADADSEETPTPLPEVPALPTASPSRTASPTATTILPPAAEATPGAEGGLALSIVPGRSSAAFRVNEQLVGRDLPGDAVGSTAAVSGVIAIGPDGEVDAGQSRVVVDLNGLRSDNGMRDAYVRRTILDVDAYPNAVFVPERAEGLPFPLPESGAATFRLVGKLTIHGTTREVAWDVAARRTGSEVTGTATTTITFSNFELEPPSVAAVISVSDEIRLEIALVANVAR